MLVHFEVAERSNCETTAPESDILAKINTEVCSCTRRGPVDFDFHSLFLSESWLQKSYGGEIKKKKRGLWDVSPVKHKSNGLARGRLLPPHSPATTFKPLAIGFILSASSEEGSRGHINAPASSGAAISCADALIFGPGAAHVTTLRRPLRQEMARCATQQLLHSWRWAKSDWPLAAG